VAYPDSLRKPRGKDKRIVILAVLVALGLILGVSLLPTFRGKRDVWSASIIDFAESGTFYAVEANITNSSPSTLTMVNASVDGSNIGGCVIQIPTNESSVCQTSGDTSSCSRIGLLPVKLALVATFSDSQRSEIDLNLSPRGSPCPVS
jgi:hypothetical protein